MGRLDKQKGFDLLLDAYAGLPHTAAKPAPPLVIVGEGEERTSLTQLAHTLAIADRVHLAGEVKTPDHYYAGAECFVLSSRAEGFPNVILEAMTHGCPVVSFDCPTGPREIIQHNRNGLLVKNGDVAGLTKAIAKVLYDTKLRQRLGEAGRKRVREFDIRRIAQEWLKA